MLKTIAHQKEGVAELAHEIDHYLKKHHINNKHYWLLAEKAYLLIQQHRMQGVDKAALKEAIEHAGPRFNLYRFVEGYR